MKHRRSMLLGGVLALLMSCGPTLTETIVELDGTKLTRLLNAVRTQIPQGITEHHIAAIEKDFRVLPVNGTKAYTIPVTHEGTTTTLDLHLRKEGTDAIEIHFHGPPNVTEAIKQTIKKTPLDVTP